MLPPWDVGLDSIAAFACAGTLFSAATCFLLARSGFRRAWAEFRLLRQTRLARASGLLSPELGSARLRIEDSTRHLSPELIRLLREPSRFGPLGPAPGRPGPEGDPLLRAIHEWDSHHHDISMSFVDSLKRVARHRLGSEPEIGRELEPVGETLEHLIAECPNPTLRKELRLAHSGLKTGAEQNLEYVSRRLREAAQASHAAFDQELGCAQGELATLKQGMIDAICGEVRAEISKFMDEHRGFRLNPVQWGRQTAFYREFEQLRDELDRAQGAGDLPEISLIAVMVAEDERVFVSHLRASIRTRDELHCRISASLNRSDDLLRSETKNLKNWVVQENQRLQSAVSHQLLQFIERWRKIQTDTQVGSMQLKSWTERLVALRDQDPDWVAQWAA
jgi:hypothetical protein